MEKQLPLFIDEPLPVPDGSAFDEAMFKLIYDRCQRESGGFDPEVKEQFDVDFYV